jgi:hypothetical protein
MNREERKKDSQAADIKEERSKEAKHGGVSVPG